VANERQKRPLSPRIDDDDDDKAAIIVDEGHDDSAAIIDDEVDTNVREYPRVMMVVMLLNEKNENDVEVTIDRRWITDVIA
jgi:hypothetical protein